MGEWEIIAGVDFRRQPTEIVHFQNNAARIEVILVTLHKGDGGGEKVKEVLKLLDMA